MSIAETVESVRTMVAPDYLRDALTACMLSAGKDDTLPVLETVQIQKLDRTLIVRSTDRYRLTRVTITLDPEDMPSPDWTVLVATADVKRIIASLPKSRRNVSPVPVALSWLEDGGRDYAGCAVHGLSVDTGEMGARVQSFEGDFPKVDMLFPADDTDTVEMGEMGFRPAQLIDLCKMPGRRKDERVALRFRGDGKGAVSVWGDDMVRYEHLIMPVRKPV